MPACIHDAYNTRLSHALRMLLQTLCRRVLAARRSETLLTIVHAAVVSRFAAEATQRPRMRSVMPTSRGCGFASHGPLGCFAVALVVWPAGNGGRWLGMVVLDTLAGYVSKSNESDVNVR